MRFFNDTGTYVQCYLQDHCPRLFNITQVKASGEVEDSTSDPLPVAPPLSVVKQSFYPRVISMVASKLS